MKIYCDGSGWNGKVSRWAVVDGNKQLLRYTKYDIKKTNNEMEYEAAIFAILKARNGDIVITDSKLVFGQVCLGWLVNAKHLIPYVQQAKQLLDKRLGVLLLWERRDNNLAGHYLDKMKRTIVDISENEYRQ